MENIQFTIEEAVKIIDSLDGKPVAVEAQWDGDTRGWFLVMFVVMQSASSNTFEDYHLGNLSLGSDIRFFLEPNPIFEEAEKAKEIGNYLKDKYQIEFFFPSPDHPDDNCPRWIEKDKAINCEDCDKLIIPTDSPYLPKEICYKCHLKREYKT